MNAACTGEHPRRSRRRYGLAGVLPMLAALLWSNAVAAQPCGEAAPCAVPGGSYRVSPPPAAAVAVGLFLHGYQESGDEEMENDDLRASYAKAGILLVLPNGPGRTWSMPGVPGEGRSDRALIAAITDDVARRWNLPRDRFWIAGMSQGGAMVWDIACHVGGFAAYVAVAGDFWDPLPDRCEAGPINLTQIHGLTDRVFPLEGRAINRSHQGDVFAGLAILRAMDGCPTNPDTLAAGSPFVLRAWTTCTSGAELRMLLHTGGHELPDGWFDASWPWVERVMARAKSR